MCIFLFVFDFLYPYTHPPQQHVHILKQLLHRPALPSVLKKRPPAKYVIVVASVLILMYCACRYLATREYLRVQTKKLNDSITKAAADKGELLQRFSALVNEHGQALYTLQDERNQKTLKNLDDIAHLYQKYQEEDEAALNGCNKELGDADQRSKKFMKTYKRILDVGKSLQLPSDYAAVGPSVQGQTPLIPPRSQSFPEGSTKKVNTTMCLIS